MSKLAGWLLIIVAIVLVIIALQSRSDALLCHVGGTMAPVMKELAADFEKSTGVKVEINSAGSGELLANISLNKKGDLYVCHDPFMDTLMEKFKMGVDGWMVAELTPVIVVQKGNPKNIRGLKDLTRDDVELILTDYEGSSLGRMLSTIFGKAGIDFEKLNETKEITTNRSGGYAANFVATGNADASMVWNAVAYLRTDKLDVVPINEHLPVPNVDAVTSATGVSYVLTPMRVTIATLTCSEQPEKAKQFAEYLTSETATKKFEQFGFSTCKPVQLYANGSDMGKGTKKKPVVVGQKESSAGTEPVKVYAGAGLRKAIDELVMTFREKTRIVVEPEYGGSGTIMTQVQMNEDADLFMPGDVSWVEMLQEKTGKIEQQTAISYFVPVIIVQKGNPKNITNIEDFFRDDITVGLGRAQACQVGKSSDNILANYGLEREGIKNIKESLTVNEIGVWVKMNDVDAGIVWDAIWANISEDADKIDIPADKNEVSHVVVGLMKDSKKKDNAQKFVDFLVSDEGKKILQDNGFQTEAPQL